MRGGNRKNAETKKKETKKKETEEITAYLGTSYYYKFANA